jgi:hypothetical protein
VRPTGHSETKRTLDAFEAATDHPLVDRIPAKLLLNSQVESYATPNGGQKISQLK